MKGYKIEGIGSLKTKFISCSNEVNCFFVVISYACANVTTIILNGTHKNLSACQLTLVTTKNPKGHTIERINCSPFSICRQVYVFTLIFICLFFFVRGRIVVSRGYSTKACMYLSSQCVPRYKLWRKDKKRKVTIKNNILRRGWKKVIYQDLYWC